MNKEECPRYRAAAGFLSYGYETHYCDICREKHWINPCMAFKISMWFLWIMGMLTVIPLAFFFIGKIWMWALT
jgi:hypothetical protein